MMQVSNQVNSLLASLNSVCSDRISKHERVCYANYLDKYDDHLTGSIITQDISSQFERKLCCAFWDWFDCVREEISSQCPVQNLNRIDQALSEDSFLLKIYCSGYEYGTQQCWLFPLWAWIVLATTFLLLLCLATLLFVWRRHQAVVANNNQVQESSESTPNDVLLPIKRPMFDLKE